jgi:polyhydroxyalkanoate synthesis regulator phasin
MSEAKNMSQAEVQAYVTEGLKKLAEAPDSLEKNEKRLFGKLKKVSDAAQQAVKDIQGLKGQITQAEARLKSLELQAENYQGAATAYVDELVSAKFGEEPTDIGTPR